MFIKPHAVTDKVKGLAKVTDKKKLLDQHYHAIAPKATILKPELLNVPEDKFQAQFVLSWKDALASGKVLNAMDGCAQLGLDAEQMDASGPTLRPRRSS